MVHGICSRLYKDIHDSGFTAIESCDSRFYVSFKCWSTAKAKNEKSNEIVQLFKCSIEDLPALAMPAAFKAGTTMPVTSIPDEPPTFSVDENPALIDGEDATSQPQLSIDKKTWLHGWLQQSESASWLALPRSLSHKAKGRPGILSIQAEIGQAQENCHPSRYQEIHVPQIGPFSPPPLSCDGGNNMPILWGRWAGWSGSLA